MLDVYMVSAAPQVASHEAAIVVLLHPDHAPTPADAEALKAAAGWSNGCAAVFALSTSQALEVVHCRHH